MIDCQLATGSESPQLGGEQQHQLPHLLLNWKGALLAYNCLIVLSSLLLLLLYLGNLSTTTQRIFSIKGGAHPFGKRVSRRGRAPWALLGEASRRRAQGCNSSYIEEWVFGPSDRNELYHTPLLSKI